MYHTLNIIVKYVIQCFYFFINLHGVKYVLQGGITVSELRKLLRELRGKESLREAAKRMGLSHSYLSILEKGTDPRSNAPVNPSPDTLKLISEAYHYPYIKLLRLAGYIDDIDRSEEKDFESFIQDPELRRWHRELPKSDEEDLRRLKRIWEAYKDDE